MKNILIAILILACTVSVYGQSKRKQKEANKQTAEWRYEITPSATVSAQGTCVIKVWSYSKDPRVATEQAKKNAVHGVIFKGVAATERTRAFKALVSDPAKEQEAEGFFNAFFADGGDYMRYVSNTTTGMIEAGDLIKVSKNEYKVGVTVTVQYDQLRGILEKQGMAKTLSSGF